MSPIEIAKAFHAPLLSHEHSNATADDLAKSTGSMPVIYGLVSEKGARANALYRGYAQNFAMEQEESRFEITSPAQVTSLRR